VEKSAAAGPTIAGESVAAAAAQALLPAATATALARSDRARASPVEGATSPESGAANTAPLPCAAPHTAGATAPAPEAAKTLLTKDDEPSRALAAASSERSSSLRADEPSAAMQTAAGGREKQKRAALPRVASADALVKVRSIRDVT
jgi:hypothetical protein